MERGQRAEQRHRGLCLASLFIAAVTFLLFSSVLGLFRRPSLTTSCTEHVQNVQSQSTVIDTHIEAESGQEPFDIKVAICTSIKDEQPDDLEEWVLYYKWLGVDTISITENTKKVTPAIAEKMQPYVEAGLVELDAWGRDEAAQLAAFQKCFKRLSGGHAWVAFFDSDEYLMLLESGATLKGLLEEFKEHPALAVNWITFGPSSRQERPPEGGVLRWYSQCRPHPHAHFKVITNSHRVANVKAPTPHNMVYKDGAQAVTESFEPIPHKFARKCKKNCRSLPGTSYPAKQSKRVALFHYTTKSWEDFESKMARGGGSPNSKRKGPSYFDRMQRQSTQIGGICDEGIKAWPHCCTPAHRLGA